MKILVVAVLSVLILNHSSVSFADDVVGRAELTTWSDGSGPSGSIDIWEQNGTILGQGFSVGGGNGTINLTRTATGVQGYSLDRFFNITCDATSCSDQGSANMNLTLTRNADGFVLDGALDFVPVHAVVSGTSVTISADSSYQLTANADGSFSGDGGTTEPYFDTFTAQLTSSGTLQGLKDPAVFIAVILNSAVR